MRKSKSWIVAKIKPHQDKITLINLEKQKFDFFQPTLKTMLTTQNQFKEIIKPVFPGYIFVAVNREKNDWFRIKSTRGVSKVITFGNEIPLIRDELINELKYRFSPNKIPIPADPLKIGMNVEITNGPFAQLFGKIDEIKANQRIWILLDILGTQTRVSINSLDLTPHR